jgi:hypothetical protein
MGRETVKMNSKALSCNNTELMELCEVVFDKGFWYFMCLTFGFYCGVSTLNKYSCCCDIPMSSATIHATQLRKWYFALVTFHAY